MEANGMELVLSTLARITSSISKLDEQMQCVRATLSEIQGLILMQSDSDDEDETDDEATHSTTTDDGSETDMSFVVEDHSSSGDAYDTDDSM
jgi:hypothetical protein